MLKIEETDDGDDVIMTSCPASLATAADEVGAWSAQEESVSTDRGQSVQDDKDDSTLFSFINKGKVKRKGDLEQI